MASAQTSTVAGAGRDATACTLPSEIALAAMRLFETLAVSGTVMWTVQDDVLGRETGKDVVEITEEYDEHGSRMGQESVIAAKEDFVSTEASNQLGRIRKGAVVDEDVIVGAFCLEASEL